MSNVSLTGTGLGRAPARITILYLLFGLLWIWLSDRSLVWFGFANDHAFFAAVFKGSLFIIITSALLYWLIRREITAVKRSESLLRAVIEGTTDAVFVKDRSGRYLLANRSAAHSIGLPLSEIIGRNDLELFETASAEQIIANDSTVMSEGAVVNADETISNAGGSRTFHAIKVPYRDENGVLAGMIGVSRDITERKQMEKALRESEMRFRELADTIPQIIWESGPDGEITNVNVNGSKYTGLKVDELTGRKWENLVHPDDIIHAREVWTQTLKDGVPRPIEMRFRRADGEYRWHICRQRPIQNDAGKITSWVGTNTDIDDLKRAEAAHRETESRLREAQRIARMGSWSWDPASNQVWWSIAEFELFGVNRHVVKPSFDVFLSLVHPEDRAIGNAHIEAMKAGIDEIANDMRVIRPDGTCIWIHSRARATRDAKGILVRIEGIDQDITAQRLTEAKAQESEKRLQAAVEVAGLGVIVIDYDRQIAELSQRAAEQFGFPQAASISRSELHDRIHPDNRTEMDQLIANAFDPAAAVWFSMEHRVIRPNGDTRWLNLRKQVSFADGRPSRAVVVSLDVTDRRLAEDALRESEKRYRLLFESNPYPMWVFDSDTLRFQAVNDAAIQAYGYSRQDFLAMTIRDIRPVEDLPRLEEAIARLGPDLARLGLWRHRRKDGSIFDVDVSAHELPEAASRSQLVLALDVTQRMQAERERDALLARLQLYLKRMPIAYILFDAESRYSEWNPAAEKMFGYTRDEIIGKPLYFLVHPDDRDLVHSNSDRLHSGEVEIQSVNRSITKDGRVIICEWHNTSLFTPGGAFMGILSMALDITDRVQAEEALRSSEQRLRLALESAGAVAFTWDIKNDKVTRYFSKEPALPVTDDRFGKLAEVRSRIHRDDVSGFDSRLNHCLANGKEYTNEYRVIRSDGTSAHLQAYGYLDRAEDGSPLRLIGMSIDVTSRVAASEALRKSEERLQEAARVVGFGVFEHDHRTQTYFWSARLREIYGYDLDAPANLDVYVEMIHPADRARMFEAIKKAHDPAGDGRFDVEHRIIRPADGRVRWLEIRSQTWFEGEGTGRQPVRTVGATVDVTDAQLAAEALRISEERYRLLVDTLPTSVHIIDGGVLTFCNPACVQLFGANSVADLLGKSPRDLFHPETLLPMFDQFGLLKLTQEELPSVEAKIVRLDGQIRTVHVVATPVSNFEHPDTYLVCLNDITERERATTLLRTVLDSVSDSIVTIDKRGMVRSVNPAAVRKFGYAEDELVGGNINVLMPEPFRGKHDGYITSYLNTGVSKLIGIGREVECVRRDGTRFPAELNVTEFSLENQKYFTGVLRDITERKRLEEQFRQAQKMEAVGQLAGGVAHDFNNLLTVINGYSELLLMTELAVGDQRRESVAAIRDAGERAARLTQQLLAFSRKAIIEPKLINVSELVTESAKLLRRLIGENIMLAVVTAPTPVRVKADPGQLEQVIMNLVVNARDAMPTGGRLTIETTIVAPNEGDSTQLACLSVIDTGHGMSDEVMEKIFEPFFTTKGVGKGTGLGLAVVHGVVTQNGGRVVIESAIGVGTKFHVLLPLVVDRDAGLVEETTMVASRGTETVLLVEDEDAVRTIARISLESQGFSVLEADGGTEALKLAESYNGKIHLLVSDVVMPEMGGRQLLEAIRRFRPDLRVLFMSGYTDDAILLHGVIEATDAFIQKPFTPLALARKVREVIDTSYKLV